MQDSVVRICRSVLPEYEGQCCQKMQDSFTRIRDAPDLAKPKAGYPVGTEYQAGFYSQNFNVS
jgi:hypothetical protein